MCRHVDSNVFRHGAFHPGAAVSGSDPGLRHLPRPASFINVAWRDPPHIQTAESERSGTPWITVHVGCNKGLQIPSAVQHLALKQFKTEPKRPRKCWECSRDRITNCSSQSPNPLHMDFQFLRERFLFLARSSEFAPGHLLSAVAARQSQKAEDRGERIASN